MLILLCAIGTRLGYQAVLLHLTTKDVNLWALYDDEGMRTVTVEFAAQTANKRASNQSNPRRTFKPHTSTLAFSYLEYENIDTANDRPRQNYPGLLGGQ